jgi:hypothetical protein
MVQALDAFGPRLLGVQFKEVGVVAATKLTVVLAETLFSVAVRVALWLVLSAAVVAAKVAVVEPAATAIDAGTVRALAVLVRVTVTPPAGAAWFRVMVQVLDAFGPRLLGKHVKDDGVVTATRLTVVLAETLFSVAVRVAIWLVVSVVVVAAKVAVVEPAARAIDAGTVRALAVLVRVTVTPPAGAA